MAIFASTPEKRMAVRDKVARSIERRAEKKQQRGRHRAPGMAVGTKQALIAGGTLVGAMAATGLIEGLVR